MNNTTLLSDTIKFLRFPLIVGVVFIHTNFIGVEEFTLFNNIDYLLSNIFARLSVPLFFFISGFLFFWGVNFSKKVYMEKIKKRFKSLFLPYLFWNTIVIAGLLLAQITGIYFDSGKDLLNLNLWGWISLYYNFLDGSFPINMSLWFVRDLMFIVLLSPFIYVLLEKIGKIVLFVLGTLWFFRGGESLFGILFLCFGNFFFFSFGAYFAIHKKNFVDVFSSKFSISIILYSILVLLQFVFRDFDFVGYIHRAGILFGMVSVVSIVSKLLKIGYLKSNCFLEESSSFLFFYHIIPLSFLITLFFNLFDTYTNIKLIILYFVIPLIIILFGLFIFALGKRITPNFMNFICGFRIKEIDKNSK